MAITGETYARRYAVELDAYRAEQAAAVVDELIHGDCLNLHCPVESFGLLFLNPPYDWTIGETRSDRTERVFLAHTYRWLKTGGVLALVTRRCTSGTAARLSLHSLRTPESSD
jgi:hypothetical protein